MDTRSRPFSCTKCGDRFKSATVLKNHEKFGCGTKTERVFCIECQRSYCSMSKYIEHFKKFQHRMNFDWNNKKYRCHREYVSFWRDDDKICFDYYHTKKSIDRRRWTLENMQRNNAKLFHTSLIFDADLLAKPELQENMMIRIPFPKLNQRRLNVKYPKWNALKYKLYDGTLINVFAIYSHIMHTAHLTATVCCSKIDKINSELEIPKYFCALAFFPEAKKKESKKTRQTKTLTSSSDEDSSDQEDLSDQPTTSVQELSSNHDFQVNTREPQPQDISWITECLAEETKQEERKVFLIDSRVNQDLSKFENVFIIVHAARHIYLLVYFTSTKRVIVFDSLKDWVSKKDRTFHIEKIGKYIYKSQVKKFKITDRARDLLPKAGDCNFYIYNFIYNFINGLDPAVAMNEDEMIKMKKTYFVSSLETTEIGTSLLSILDKYVDIKAT